jgi:glycine oxidase
VVGGGVIGASVAYHLARAGAKVLLLERDTAGSGASGAAAGMLAPLAEAEGPGPFLDLALQSLREYPALAETLRSESGVDPEFVRSGLLRLAFSDEEAETLKRQAEHLAAAGHDARWLSANDARELEPGLSPNVVGAILTLQEGHVRSPRLVTALLQSAQQYGTTACERREVLDLLRDGGRVVGVATTSGDLSCGHVVLCAGAWTGLLAERTGLPPVPITPVRGQMAVLRSPSAAPRRILMSAFGYVVGKTDGTVLVGATMEHAGFDCRVTPWGMSRMLEALNRMAPGLESADFQQGWAGLRPGTADGLPLMGPFAGISGLTLCSGHYRNGVLLSPATGRLVAQLITTGEVPPDLYPFSPDRSSGGASDPRPAGAGTT